VSAKDLYLVFSRPSERVSEEEFMAWYDEHIPEILQTKGFLSAQRYRVKPVVAETEAEEKYRYLVLYETEGDIDALRSALNARVDAGEIVLPDWFKETQYLTWTCEPVGA
jgi:heme-degrading monooxygenase HmoA